MEFQENNLKRDKKILHTRISIDFLFFQTYVQIIKKILIIKNQLA